MKKIILTALVVLALGWADRVQAQDCNAIVRPLCILRDIDTNTYPAEKLQIFCHYSQCAFFITQQLPERAVVNDISVLTNTITGEKVSRNFVADLNTISFWGYDFDKFRPHGWEGPIYFRMGRGSTTQYLGVRTYSEAMARSTHPEQFKD